MGGATVHTLRRHHPGPDGEVEQRHEDRVDLEPATGIIVGVAVSAAVWAVVALAIWLL